MSFSVRAIAPSNIAFLKYWGKRDSVRQWPANDSLSMTLSSLATTTEARIIDAPDHSLSFHKQSVTRGDPRFVKAFRHLDGLAKTFGFSDRLALETSNSFPMGAGIASSASGLAALTLAALSAWTKSSSLADLEGKDFDRQRLAQLSRQGSGSAGRSLWGGFVRWNAGPNPDQQSFDPVFDAKHWALRDSIVLFSKSEKSKSSSDAHGDAWSSPLFRPRLAGSPERMQRMLRALEKCSMSELGPLLEEEALEMHAVMMTATPAQNYLSEAALSFLVDLREARRQGLIEAYFTIDAGPNIHIIHCETERLRLRSWLETRFTDSDLLHDQVGTGPSVEGLNRE